MSKYLYRLTYTTSGLEGTVKEGFAAREAFFRSVVDGLGGRTESAYWAYGDVDIFIVVDLPDSASATALSLALARTGSFRVTTTVLLSAAEMDAGVKKMPAYRAPGT
ncbi:MAG TPA: GYD domain-containing protein [Candidatus Limnocylindrales bacterium]